MTPPSDGHSLEDIESAEWGDAPSDASTMVARIHELRRVPVGQLSIDDVRLLIGQKVGVHTLVPIAIGYLSSEPLLTATFYPGDLLRAVLRIPNAYWGHEERLGERLESIIDSIDEVPSVASIDVVFDLRSVRGVEM